MGLFIGTKAQYAASQKKGRGKGGAAFDKQFAAARKAGKAKFSYGGKTYTTEVAKGPKATVATAVAKPTAALPKRTNVLPTRRPETTNVLPTRRPETVPAPASRLGAQILNQAEANRRNPVKADPVQVARFAPRGPAPTVTTAKTDRLAVKPTMNTTIRREPAATVTTAKTDRVKKLPKIDRSNERDDYGSLRFFHPERND